MIKQYPLRIDEALKKQIESIAKIKKRSFNNMVEVILTGFIDDLTDDEKADIADKIFWKENGDRNDLSR